MSLTQSEPETPLHVGPDTNLDLNNLKELDEKDIEDLDLDPSIDETPSFINIPAQAATAPLWKRAFNYIENNNNTQSRHPSEYDNAHDYQPRVNFKSPFSSDDNLKSILNTSLPKTSLNDNNDFKKSKRLSMSQQSKFIVYVDSRLMEIQRKFVQSRGLNNERGYKTLAPLLHDIKSLLDFIWYSIDNVPYSDYLLQLNRDNTPLHIDEELEIIPQFQKNSNNFGQSSFIIKIADDLIDYIEKFTITDDPLDEEVDTIPKLFKLFFILDWVFASLILGKNENKVKLNGTDRVRFIGIAERTRMRLPLFFEKNKIHGYHFELSKIYEQSLDLCAC